MKSKVQRSTVADAEFLAGLQPTSSVGELHKSNVLRLEVEELIRASRLDYLHTKWHTAAHDYITAVTGIIENIRLQKVEMEDPACPFPRRSDKMFPGGLSSKQRLRCRPTGCLQAEGLGMMTISSNAKVLPTLDLRVVLPDDLLETKDHLKHRYFDVSCWTGLLGC